MFRVGLLIFVWWPLTPSITARADAAFFACEAQMAGDWNAFYRRIFFEEQILSLEHLLLAIEALNADSPVSVPPPNGLNVRQMMAWSALQRSFVLDKPTRGQVRKLILTLAGLAGQEQNERQEVESLTSWSVGRLQFFKVPTSSRRIRIEWGTTDNLFLPDQELEMANQLVNEAIWAKVMGSGSSLGRPDFPQLNVSRDEVFEFVAKLNEINQTLPGFVGQFVDRSGKDWIYDLVSEAELEYVIRDFGKKARVGNWEGKVLDIEWQGQTVRFRDHATSWDDRALPISITQRPSVVYDGIELFDIFGGPRSHVRELAHFYYRSMKKRHYSTDWRRTPIEAHHKGVAWGVTGNNPFSTSLVVVKKGKRLPSTGFRLVRRPVDSPIPRND